jgi:hypothetical protein
VDHNKEDWCLSVIDLIEGRLWPTCPGVIGTEGLTRLLCRKPQHTTSLWRIGTTTAMGQGPTIGLAARQSKSVSAAPPIPDMKETERGAYA